MFTLVRFQAYLHKFHTMLQNVQSKQFWIRIPCSCFLRCVSTGKKEIWKYGNMKIGGQGNREIWKYGNLEIWKYGNKEIWKYGNIEIWKYLDKEW